MEQSFLLIWMAIFMSSALLFTSAHNLKGAWGCYKEIFDSTNDIGNRIIFTFLGLLSLLIFALCLTNIYFMWKPFFN